MRLIFLGAPGTGKGTQGKILAQAKGWPHISTGDILRAAVAQKTALGLQAQSYMDSGQLVPDSLMNDLVGERLTQADCANGFILDGFPRTINQAEALDDFLKRHHQSIDKVVAFEVESEILIRRLTSRRLCRKCGKDYNLISNPPPADGKCSVCGGEIYQRDDDNEATVRNRLEVYHAQTAPLMNYYREQRKLVSINANQDIAAVQASILEGLASE